MPVGNMSGAPTAMVTHAGARYFRATHSSISLCVSVL